MYDPMVAKLIVWDTDRELATARMLRALGEYEVGGLTTLIPFHQAILATEAVGQRRDLPRPDRGQEVAEDHRARGAARTAGATEDEEEPRRRARLPGRGRRQALRRQGDRRRRCPRRPAARPPGARSRRSASARPAAAPPPRATRSGRPLQGNVFKVPVEKGQEVAEGDLVCVIEAMKMENEITAHKAGKITELPRQGGRRRQQRRPAGEDRVAASWGATRGRRCAARSGTRRASSRPTIDVVAGGGDSTVPSFLWIGRPLPPGSSAAS